MRNAVEAARRLAFFALTGLAGPFLLVAAGRAADVPTEKALPPSTVAFVKVDDASRFRAALKATQFGRLLDDPAMKPLREDIATKLDKNSDKLKDKIGVTLSELFSLPQGPASIAVIALDDADKQKTPVAFLVSADAGSKEKDMEAVLTKSTKLAEEDHSVTTETFKGLKLTILKPSKEEDKDDPPLVWTKQGTVFHIGTDLDVLKDMLAHVGGRDESLASNESFGHIRERAGKEAQLLWFIDVARIVKLGIKQQAKDQANGNAQTIEGFVQLLGINSVKALGGGLAFNVGEFDQLSRTFVDSPGPAQGLFKLFPLPKADLKPQPWVPATTAAYQTISWDMGGAYNGLEDLANSIQPGMLAGFEKQMAGPDGPNLSFKKDLFGPLGKRITVISDFKKPTGQKAAAERDEQASNDSRTLVAIALQDQKGAQNTFNKLLDAAKTSPKKREFQGVTIYDFDVPELPNAPATGVQGPVSLAIAKGHLFVAFEPTLLEQVLRGGGDSLADTAEFRAAAKHYPDASSTFSYQQSEKQAKTLYDMIKSGQFAKAIEGANKRDDKNAPDLSGLANLIDPNKLPEFSVFAKYLAPAGGYGAMDEDGMTLTSFTLKKTEP